MEKKRGVILLFLIIIIALPLIDAGNYGSGSYSIGGYSVQSAPAGVPAQEGGGSYPAIYECSSDSDCGEKQYCSNYRCHDGCSSDKDCNTKEGEACFRKRCVKLFDIKITDFESPIKLGTEFKFTYFIKGMADISGDVEVHFWIERDGEKVTSGHDTIYVGNFEEKTETTKIYMPTTVESGVYTFFVQLDYENYTADAHRVVEIIVDEEGGAEIIIIEEGGWNINWGNIDREMIEEYRNILTRISNLIILTLIIVFLVSRKRD